MYLSFGHRNKIKRLDKRTLDRIDAKFGSGSGDDGPKKLNLNWNPWECDCYLRPFVKWVKNTRSRLYEEVIHTDYNNGNLNTGIH